ncbi:MAG: hypothetical protein DRO40_05295 [Thermoprotei archaeon]|nr:MAG: hypothetical protein DRO40_05295 [Thermoprotei archaeon]
MSISRKSLAIVLITTFILLGGFITVSYNPGICIEFRLYEVVDGEIVNTTSVLSRPDIVLSIEVIAIAPPQYREDLLLVHKAHYKGSNTIFIPSDKLYDVAKTWITIYNSRSGNIEKTYSGLILRVFIYDEDTGELLYQLYDSISYRPIDIVKGETIKYTVYLSKNSPKASKIESSYVSTFSITKLATEISPMDRVDHPHYYRELVAQIKPEDLVSSLPSSYFNEVNGKLYVKTPVLIAWNKYSLSGSVSSSINLGIQGAVIGVYPTLTSGEIIPKIENGVLPEVTLWKGSGLTWGGEGYYYYRSQELNPNEQWWAWIWARPIYSVYRVYYCDGYYCEYSYNDIDHVITDILTEGNGIVGGENYGLPAEDIMYNFYDGTYEVRLEIDGTALDNGYLDPGESIAFEQIFQYCDTCGADFEVGIPVGAFAAIAICAALGLPTGGLSCTTAVAFASAFAITISAEGPSVYISGGAENEGDDPDYPGDYNVYEVVYVRISSYQYKVDPPWWCFWCGPCYYNVPAGIYFEFR